MQKRPARKLCATTSRCSGEMHFAAASGRACLSEALGTPGTRSPAALRLATLPFGGGRRAGPGGLGRLRRVGGLRRLVALYED